MDEFCNLHVHSDSSAFDGLGTEAAFVERAVTLGQTALAFTDHGTLRGWYDASKACKAAGIKHILGVEAYFCDDATVKGLTDEEKAALKDRPEAQKDLERIRRGRDHITLWAVNQQGVLNLQRLMHEAFRDGFYYKPRIDWAGMAKYAEGVVASTGCPSGLVPSLLQQDRVADAERRLGRLFDTFHGRLFVEVMPHPLAGAGHVTRLLIEMAKAHRLPLLATQDAHYVEQSQSTPHEAFLCVQTNGRMHDPNHFCFTGKDFHLRSRAEMHEAFRDQIPYMTDADIRSALDNTVRFAEMCQGGVTPGSMGQYLVAPPLPAGQKSHDSWLMALVVDGVRKRFGCEPGDLPQAYRDRLLFEVKDLCSRRFAPYMVFAWDLVEWARKADIPVGPGRGSAAGCLVSYVLGITNVDPLVWDLSYERFLAPGRSDLPDIDLDFSVRRRDEVLHHLTEQYGEDHVCHISTRNRLKGKGALNNVCRVFSLPESEYEEVSAQIVEGMSEEERDEDETPLKVALEQTDAGRAFTAHHPHTSAVALALEGTTRAIGIHASGVIVASKPVVEIAPVEYQTRNQGDPVPVCAYDMRGCEAMGLVKIDILGLDNLDVLKQCEVLTGVLCDSIPWDDSDTMAAFTAHRFGGIFQYDSPAARSVSQGFTFRSVHDIAVITALDRPGPMMSGMSKTFIARARGDEPVEAVHPAYDAAFERTFGVPVYQEQIVALVKGLCGYDPVQADGFRRKVSKKKGLESERDPFVAGATAAGMDLKRAVKLFDDLVGFGSYAFNASHAYSYAIQAYWGMWFKVHHPAVFYTACLTVEEDREKAMRFAAEARQQGIMVEPPDVTSGRSGFHLSQTFSGSPVILGSMMDVKGVGEGAAEAIHAGGPYRDLGAFLEVVVASKAANAGTVQKLAEVGALRRLVPHMRIASSNAHLFVDAARKGVTPRFDPQALLAVPDWTLEERADRGESLYPMWAEGQRTALEMQVDAVQKAARRDIVTPDCIPEEAPSAVLAARFSTVKPISRGGGKMARLTLVGPMGTTLSVTADPDVYGRHAALLGKAGKNLLCVVSRPTTPWPRLEAVWSLKEAIHGTADPMLLWLLEPQNTPCGNVVHVERAVAGLEEEQVTTIGGLVLRVVDKRAKTSGNMMRVVSLLGARGLVRFHIFHNRFDSEDGEDARRLRAGHLVVVQIRKWKEEMLNLTDAPIRFVSQSGDIR